MITATEILNHIVSKSNSGVTLDDIKTHFDIEGDTVKDVQKFIEALIGLDFIKKDGKGRGTRYYGKDFEITKITNENPYSTHETKDIVDNAIDVKDCLTTKDKINKVLNSDHKLSKPIHFSYREKIGNFNSNQKVIEYLRDGCKDIDVKIYYDPLKHSNVVYSKKENLKYNAIWIGMKNNLITLELLVNGSYTDPTTLTFQNWEEFIKWARFNFVK